MNGVNTIVDIDWLLASKPEGTLLAGEVPVVLEYPERLDVVSVEPVLVVGNAVVRGHVMTVDATLKTTVVYRCVRCLSPFSSVLTATLHEQFSQLPVNEEDEDNEIIFISEPMIHMDSYVEQALVLALQQNPVCNADCKGLCSVCGADLNIKECGCNRTLIDPRLEVLAQVLDEMSIDKDSD
jgi:uncharacterized protein